MLASAHIESARHSYGYPYGFQNDLAAFNTCHGRLQRSAIKATCQDKRKSWDHLKIKMHNLELMQVCQTSGHVERQLGPLCQ